MTRSVGGLLHPIVREYFLRVTSDFIHCLLYFYSATTSGGMLYEAFDCMRTVSNTGAAAHVFYESSSVLFTDEMVFARDTRVKHA